MAGGIELLSMREFLPLSASIVTLLLQQQQPILRGRLVVRVLVVVVSGGVGGSCSFGEAVHRRSVSKPQDEK